MMTTNQSIMSPEMQGEQSVSGSMPDVEADADLLENAHAVGEQLQEGEEHPKEVDLARDVDEAEVSEQSH